MKSEVWDAFGLAWQMDEPFWGSLFASLPRSMDDGMHSIGLKPLGETAVQLAYHPGWPETQPENVLRKAIRHELCHLLLGHPFRGDLEVLPYFYHLACDGVVTRVLQEQGLRQAPSPIVELTEFREVLHQSARDIAILLQQLWRSEISDGAEASRWVDLEHATRQARDRHIYWAELNCISSFIKPWWMQWRSEAKFHLSKQIGDATSWWRDELENAYHLHTTLPWRQILRRFISSTASTRLKNTLHRPSKRYGTRPGIKISTRQSLWVAIDTSGSISQPDLNLFFQSLEPIYRMGIRLTVLESDLAIRRRYPFTGKAPDEVFGRGGTRWDPVLEAATSERPDGLIYFTDGLAAAPQHPCKVPLLWMIAPDGISPGEGVWNSLPGSVVKM